MNKSYDYDRAVCPCGCGNIYDVITRRFNGKTQSIIRCAVTKKYYPVLLEEDTLKSPPPIRTKGISEFDGWVINNSIFIIRGHSVRIHSHIFNFTGGKVWESFNKFIRSKEAGDDHSQGHYPVDFTTQEANRLRGDAISLFETYIERQPAIKKRGNKQYEPYARLKIELL